MTVGQNEIMEFMQDELALDVSDINADSPLFSSGIIDSFSLISVMTFLEQRAGISIEPSEVTLENFDSVNSIVKYIAHKS